MKQYAVVQDFLIKEFADKPYWTVVCQYNWQVYGNPNVFNNLTLAQARTRVATNQDKIFFNFERLGEDTDE